MAGKTRREVLRLMGATALVCAGCGGNDPSTSSAIAAGKVSDYPVGTLKGLAGWSLIVGRDSGGLYAMSSLCTHAGCDMVGGVSSNGVFCNCHGSSFDANGNVTGGPARSALQHFALKVDSTGAITVDGTTQVGENVRVQAT
jgi:Rieske Fe-S protein